MNRQRCSRWACVGLVLAACWRPSDVQAAQYAAMEEVPVTGGELRLQVPTPAGQVAFALEHTRVRAEVAASIASVSVEQRFKNSFSEPVTAVYVFPLPAKSAVTHYQLTIGERTIFGKIKPRAVARQQYEAARANGNTAALLEQSRPNVFCQQVANIAPGEEVRVLLRFVQQLAYSAGRYELVFPMVVAPRFDPRAARDEPTAKIQAIRYQSPAWRLGHTVDLQVALHAAVPIASISVPSHRAQIQRFGAERAKVSLAPTERYPNKDFVLRFSTSSSRSMIGFLTHRQGGDHGYFTMVVQPKAKYQHSEAVAREMIVVIDRSGSMQGPPLQQAKSIAAYLLATLNPRDSFNVVDFADTTRAFSRRARSAKSAEVARAQRYVAGLAAGGKTVFVAGVVAALKRPPPKRRMRMIYLISDGQVSNERQILTAARRVRGVNRIFTIGIGAAPNRYLLDRLATVARGFASYLAPREDPRQVASQLVLRSAYPYLTDISIDWGGLSVTDLIPDRLPDLYMGQPLVITGRYRSPARGVIQVKGKLAQKALTTTLAVSFPASRQQPAVAMLWARRRVSQLLQGERNEGSVRRAVTAVGLKYGLVTQYTSFVAIDRTRVVATNARVIHQPVALPEGMVSEAGSAPPPSRAEIAQPPVRPPPQPKPQPRRRSRASPYWPSGEFGGGGHGGGGGGGGGGSGLGGGGDIDPLLILLVAGLLPAAWISRRNG